MNNFFDHKILELGQWLEALFNDVPSLKIVVHIVLSTLPLMLAFMGAFAFSTWLERKGLARSQNRRVRTAWVFLAYFNPWPTGLKC